MHGEQSRQKRTLTVALLRSGPRLDHMFASVNSEAPHAKKRAGLPSEYQYVGSATLFRSVPVLRGTLGPRLPVLRLQHRPEH